MDFFRRVRKIAKNNYQLCRAFATVPPPDRMAQLGSRWSDFHEV
jgi:hypothetical protein